MLITKLLCPGNAVTTDV